MSSKTLRRKGNGTFGGQNAGKSFKIKGKQLPSTSVQRLFSAVYRPDTLNSSKSSGGDTVRVRPPLPAPDFDADFDTICVIYFLHPLKRKSPRHNRADGTFHTITRFPTIKNGPDGVISVGAFLVPG